MPDNINYNAINLPFLPCLLNVLVPFAQTIETCHVRE